MLKIYGVLHSRTFRCLWMLEELGLAYELVEVDHRRDEHKSPQYTALNPNQHVPTLVDGDLVLWESMAINLYLADKYDGGLKPKTVAARGLACQWSFWGMLEAEAFLITALRHRSMYPPEQRVPARADEAEAALQKPFAILNGALAGRPFLLGGEFSVADLNLSHMFGWGRLGGCDLSVYPHLARWLEACLSRPAFLRLRQRVDIAAPYKPGWQFD